MRKKDNQFPESTGVGQESRLSQPSEPGSPQAVRLHVARAIPEATDSRQLSTGPVDITLSTAALNAHAEAMRNELVARLTAERYSFPTWFKSPKRGPA